MIQHMTTNVDHEAKCPEDIKCQRNKHLDYGGGSQKKNKLT